jgi:hypothetical protein
MKMFFRDLQVAVAVAAPTMMLLTLIYVYH